MISRPVACRESSPRPGHPAGTQPPKLKVACPRSACLRSPRAPSNLVPDHPVPFPKSRKFGHKTPPWQATPVTTVTDTYMSIRSTC
ncbi:hypothetical protein BVI2075_970060 [Burkholderia vietnamiensis]|nr:hypothetical protein BVI2075_970060 [Burkholderia vietnamiensis]